MNVQPAMPSTAQWRRLHPLSPVVRFGRLLLAFIIVTLPSLESTRTPRGFDLRFPALVWTALLAVACVTAVLTWVVTKWRIDGAALRIDTGILRRQSIRIPLTRIQAVDIVVPLAARVLGLAEVRVVSAGRGGQHGRLTYLAAAEAEAVRGQLLALAHGLAAETPQPPSLVLLHVDNARLIGALSVRARVAVPLMLMLASIAGIVISPAAGVAAVSSVLTVVVAAVVAVGRAFNEDFDFTISEAGDGVRLDRGLLQRRHETIPYGRMQAVRLTQPLLWRPFGWWRLEVDVARQRTPREGDAQGAVEARTLVPVARRPEALWVLARVFPDAGVTPPAGAEAPPRALLKAPLSHHFLAAWMGTRYAYARTGRVQEATVIVPLDKIQSLRLHSGPVQRRLRLATLSIDTAGQRWQAAARCRDQAEAERLIWQLSERARLARRGAARPVAGAGMAISSASWQ